MKQMIALAAAEGEPEYIALRGEQVILDGFAKWQAALRQRAQEVGGRWIVGQTGMWFTLHNQHRPDSTEEVWRNTYLGIGDNSVGRVECNIPEDPQDANAITTIAKRTGQVWLMRQLRLKGGGAGVTGRTDDIKQAEFTRLAGIPGCKVRMTHPRERLWFPVAHLDLDADAIVKSTLKFVEMCRDVRQAASELDGKS
jgi:hypothetical protein